MQILGVLDTNIARNAQLLGEEGSELKPTVTNAVTYIY